MAKIAAHLPSGQGFNEGKGNPFTAADMRFTKKDVTLFAIVLGLSTAKVEIRALGKGNGDAIVKQVQLLGSDAPVKWEQGGSTLSIEPAVEQPSRHAVAYKIALAPG